MVIDNGVTIGIAIENLKIYIAVSRQSAVCFPCSFSPKICFNHSIRSVGTKFEIFDEVGSLLRT